jgi:hypothetical protein
VACPCTTPVRDELPHAAPLLPPVGCITSQRLAMALSTDRRTRRRRVTLNRNLISATRIGYYTAKVKTLGETAAEVWWDCPVPIKIILRILFE